MSTEEQLSLFAGDSHASRFPLPGSEEALLMTAISGRRCIESYKRYSPLGSLLRTLVDCSIWNSRTCYLTWKPRVTQHKHLYFQLVPSMPNTEGIESGLLHTPTAKANQMSPHELKKGSGFWPTPDASPRGPAATDLVVNQSTVIRRASGQKRGMDLQTAAKLWPTPTANLSGEANFMESLVTKDGKPAQPGERAYSPKSGKHTSVSLNRAVKMWPTPTATEHKGARKKEAMEKTGRNPLTNSLRDSVEAQSGYQSPEGKLAGSLSPDWVEWLMGYPIGWTNLSDSTEQHTESQTEQTDSKD